MATLPHKLTKLPTIPYGDDDWLTIAEGLLERHGYLVMGRDESNVIFHPNWPGGPSLFMDWTASPATIRIYHNPSMPGIETAINITITLQTFVKYADQLLRGDYTPLNPRPEPPRQGGLGRFFRVGRFFRGL
jgi:hypothetical protein